MPEIQEKRMLNIDSAVNHILVFILIVLAISLLNIIDTMAEILVIGAGVYGFMIYIGYLIKKYGLREYWSQ